MSALATDAACFVTSLAGLLSELEVSSGASAYAFFLLILVLGACLVPIPEEAAFAIGGALAARGQLSGLGLYVLGWSTVLVLDFAIFTLGRRAGRDIEETRLGRRVGAGRITHLRGVVERRGAWAVAGARFVMGMRIPVFLLAGALGMPKPRFLGAVGLAGLFSAGLPLVLGYQFGAHLDTLLEIMAGSRWVIFGAVAVAALLMGAWWARKPRA